MVLHAAQRADGGWQLSGGTCFFPRLRAVLSRVKEPRARVTTLKEGNTAISTGAPPPAMRGTWHGGVSRARATGRAGRSAALRVQRGIRAAGRYSASVRCDAGDDRYASASPIR